MTNFQYAINFVINIISQGINSTYELSGLPHILFRWKKSSMQIFESYISHIKLIYYKKIKEIFI